MTMAGPITVECPLCDFLREPCPDCERKLCEAQAALEPKWPKRLRQFGHGLINFVEGLCILITGLVTFVAYAAIFIVVCVVALLIIRALFLFVIQ